MVFVAILLGIIEGMTEFLPVSSTGHLILFVDLLKFAGPKGETFEIVIQLGAILAVCCLYRQKIVTTIKGVINSNPKDIRFAGGVVIAFLPAMVIGALFHKPIKEVLFNPFNVSVMLIIGGIVIIVAERFKPETRYKSIDDFSWPLYLKIGIFQCLALIPGTSRSGATIIGAMLLGAERKAATEFSFFLAIPTMLAATIFEIYSNRANLNGDAIQLVVIGFIAAFISALLVVRIAVRYIERHGFAPFAWYRIILGTVMLYILS